MNKYQKALNELKNSDVRLLVFKNVSEEEQPTIFDLFHSEIFALQELIDKETPMKSTEIKGVKKLKARKKPVVVEAYITDKSMDIHTLEGVMQANVGDYIITGVNGEQYPCKPDIFKKTYEIIEE